MLGQSGEYAFGWLVLLFMVGKTTVFNYVELQTYPLINGNFSGKYFLLWSAFTWSKKCSLSGFNLNAFRHLLIILNL